MGAGHGATLTTIPMWFMENVLYGVECDGANGEDGLFAIDPVVVDLHGTKTDIHSN